MISQRERDQVYADRDWWQSAGKVLDLHLLGFDDRFSATFVDPVSGKTMEVPKPVAERLLKLRPDETE